MKKNPFWLTLLTLTSAIICAGLVVGTFAVLQFSNGLPNASKIREIELKVPLRVYSADGILISEFGNERRIPIDFTDTPKELVDAVLASEDDNFFNHYGIDALGLIRAALANFKSGRSGQGASTITMQVARNFYLSPEKTYTRKIKEILLAIKLEQILTKEEILSLYLNKIFLGHRSYGFGAAAETYYGKSLNELNLAQISMLAGLPKAPSSYNPIRNPERATIRRNYVLGRMLSLNWISEETYDFAINEPVTAKRHARDTGLDAPHIAEMVRSELISQLGKEAYWQGLNVYTTIQSNKQIAAQKALRSGLQTYDRRHGYRGPTANVDLSNIGAESDTVEESYEDILRQFPYSQNQVPAVVVEIRVPANKRGGEALLWTQSAELITLPYSEASWARPYINANRKGDKPKDMGSILSVGDIVYIKPKSIAKTDIDPATEKSENEGEIETVEWELSQIPQVSGSLISMNPNTGGIISLVGGYDFFLNKYNRATQSIRQPGSNIKPFIYSAALESGFTPSSMISGAPIVLTDPAHGTRWRPQNYSGKFFGPTRIREALSKSMNLVSIRLLRSIGIPFAREYTARFGIDMNRFSSSLTMALGSGGVKPIEMISAYAVLANGGYRTKPYFIEKITDRDGEIVFQAPKPTFCDDCVAEYIPKPAHILLQEAENNNQQDPAFDSPEAIDDEEVAEAPPAEQLAAEQELEETTYVAPRVMTHANNQLTVSMLKDVVQRGTARKALALKRNDLAGKTGTTNDYVDAWFSGFNSQVVTTVWVGFDQPQTMGKGEAGSLSALPIWVDYMKVGLADVPEDETVLPEYIEPGYIDRYSGTRTTQDNPNALAELFVKEALTPEFALIQKLYGASTNDNHLTGASKEAGQYEEGLNLDQLDERDRTGSDKADSELINEDDLVDELLELKPEERIIETEDDTDGLF